MRLVAEIGLNHEGNFDLAYELIGRASRAGADAVKFRLGWRSDPGQVNYIDTDRAHRLKEWCQWWEIEYMTSIHSEEALEMAVLVDPDLFGVGSRTVVDNPRLAEWVLAENKETFVSLGRWDHEAFPFGSPSDQLRYVYSTADAPSYPRRLRGMPRRFGPEGFFGYSDRTHGIEGALLALSRGAKVLEVPFTLDKTIQGVHGEHVLSATPEELKQLDELGRSLGRVADAVDGRREAPGPSA